MSPKSPKAEGVERYVGKVTVKAAEKPPIYREISEQMREELRTALEAGCPKTDNGLDAAHERLTMVFESLKRMKGLAARLAAEVANAEHELFGGVMGAALPEDDRGSIEDCGKVPMLIARINHLEEEARKHERYLEDFYSRLQALFTRLG